MSSGSEDSMEILVAASKDWQGGDEDALNRVKGKQLTRKQWATWISRIQKTSNEQELRDAAKEALATSPH